jgi:hypothetical protein
VGKKETNVQSNIARKHGSQDDDRRQLEDALHNWRECLLSYLQREISAANNERQRAQDGLTIAFRNHGEVAEDVIEILWERLQESSTLLFRLARVSDRIQRWSFPILSSYLRIPRN